MVKIYQETLLYKMKDIAKKAQKIILDANKTTFSIQKKGRIDLVTEVDIKVNEFLCTNLSKLNDGIDIIAEEGSPKKLGHKKAQYAWVIDPLDGTTNFVHRLNHSAISIALFDYKNNESVLALVLNPFNNELFHAQKSRGAFLNDTPIKTSSINSLDKALIATGFAYDRATNPDNNLAEFSSLMPKLQGIRRFGAASLDLAYVAAGRLDGYFERNLQFWDYAAGMLLVKEAFGIASKYDGLPIEPNSGHILASNKKIHGTLMQEIQQARINNNFPLIPTR